MPKISVAHVNQQGIDLIIVPLDHTFGYKSDKDRHDVIDEIQGHAGSAGLAGTVIPVWESGRRMNFIAPPNWHPFFRSLNMRLVWANVNKEISW